ncbi:MAG: polyribonucleotide nucleotidyltransferase [Zetaproteobacteria bacterium]|nr:MAG: polyribonucleotide nucleotidyltransferase [Zetaproteobacteria bacterium]
MFDVKTVEVAFGGRPFRLETGKIARQAGGSVVAQYGDVVVHAAATATAEPLQGVDFLPLTVHYQERTYAAGRFLGGFYKREGRPSEKETLTSRLIDRPIRPLFPKGYFHDTQIIATVISADEDNNPDIVALNAASAALAISNIPFGGPVAAARVGYIDGKFVLNPTYAELERSQIDLVVAGTRDAVLMVESEAKEVPEELMLEAVLFGQEGYQPVLDAIEKLVAMAGKEKMPVEPAGGEEAEKAVAEAFGEQIAAAFAIVEKQKRRQALDAIHREALARFAEGEGAAFTPNDVISALKAVERRIVRRAILDGKPRIDGRRTDEIRPIECEVGFLPRTHGSALFTRGETQALVTVTLGSEEDMQLMESLEGVERQRFMLHYNFPPYSVGEVRRLGPPGRREIGHGRLARRALEAVIPPEEEFGYAIRVVSEITESNGSSSMATVCGASLALMDAGVPISRAVAGIAMGLILEPDGYAVLSDILGDEDHLGDMDFKVAGTERGVTAFQLDIKIPGLTREIMAEALKQAHEGRMHILEIMNQTISKPRPEISKYAPRLYLVRIDPEKIRDLIGPGGKTIRMITDSTDTKIDIEQDGTVKIFAKKEAAAEAAKKLVEEHTAEVEVGRVYEGEVVRLMDFGAIVRFLGNRDGLVHISQIAKHRVEKVSDELEPGQKVRVKVLEVDDKTGRVRLSMKAVSDENPAEDA